MSAPHTGTAYSTNVKIQIGKSIILRFFLLQEANFAG